MFLIANGPIQLSYSSTGVHPEQRSRQASLFVPGEVKDLLLVLTFVYSCRQKKQVRYSLYLMLYLLILVFLGKYLNFISFIDWAVWPLNLKIRLSYSLKQTHLLCARPSPHLDPLRQLWEMFISAISKDTFQVDSLLDSGLLEAVTFSNVLIKSEL